MKRILLTFTAFLLLFSTTGALVADAKGFSGSRGGGSSFSSKPASSPIKSTPVKSSKTTKSEKAPATSKTTKSVKPTQAPAAQVSNFKHKPAYNSYYAKPRTNTNMKRYENKSYYSQDNGFATSLMTSIGTYLVLDAILDDGEPVYIDSETGERVDPDELDAQPLDDTPEEDGGLFGIIMFCIVAAFILITLIAIIRL